MADDASTGENPVEQIDSSDASQNVSEETNNSLGEDKKNQSNFKKLAKRYKEERRERERLQAELDTIKSGKTQEDTDDLDDIDLDDDAPAVAFNSTDARLWFIENPDAKNLKEEMQDLVDDEPSRARLSLDDLYLLAKARSKKSTSKTDFDITSSKGAGRKEGGSVDFTQLSEDEIQALNPADSKKFLAWYKAQTTR